MIAVIFVGMWFLAIGIFISSLTANQFTAGLGTIGVLLALMGISLSNSLIDFYPVRKVLAFISIYARYAAFTNGIFDFSAAFYYLSICAIFLLSAYRVYEEETLELRRKTESDRNLQIRNRHMKKQDILRQRNSVTAQPRPR